MKQRNWWYAIVLSTAALGSIASLGCEGERVETGTQVQVSDQMQKEAEASANYLESQSKKPGTPRK